jgi:carbonic anhydrase/acetyltransferase-like protein (isoleucine patch superfamily)
MTTISTHPESTTITVRSYKGHAPIIADNCFIDPSAIVIGDVVLGNDCSVWPGAIIRGDMHRIRIGSKTNVQDNAVLHITHASHFNPDGWPLMIGEEVTIGHAATLHGCILGNRILVGIGAIILDGAVVEDDVMIGAGTLVPPGKILTSGHLYVGNPCRQARPLRNKEKEFFSYSAQNYVNLKNDYL